MAEVWADIPGFEGYYAVSNLGRIKSLPRVIVSGGKKSSKRAIKERILKPASSAGYQSYVLWRNHRQTTMRAHTAVALAFLGPRPPGSYVCHRDGDRAHNALANVYYGTPTENMRDARKHGTLPIGEKSGAAKLSASDVSRIRGLASTLLQREIGSAFGISQAQVSRIINGAHWKMEAGHA